MYPQLIEFMSSYSNVTTRVIKLLLSSNQYNSSFESYQWVDQTKKKDILGLKQIVWMMCPLAWWILSYSVKSCYHICMKICHTHFFRCAIRFFNVMLWKVDQEHAMARHPSKCMFTLQIHPKITKSENGQERHKRCRRQVFLYMSIFLTPVYKQVLWIAFSFTTLCDQWTWCIYM